MTNKTPVITIDGPSGVGKSSLSQIIANELHWSILESGQIYRSIALLALHKKIDIIESNIIPLAQKLNLFLIKKKILIILINQSILIQ